MTIEETQAQIRAECASMLQILELPMPEALAAVFLRAAWLDGYSAGVRDTCISGDPLTRAKAVADISPTEGW